LTEHGVLFIKTKQIWEPFIRLKHMGAIKTQPVFGMVKSAMLVIVTAVQFMTSSGIIQRQNSPFLLSLISCFRSDVEMLMYVEAVEATGLEKLLLQILQVTKCNRTGRRNMQVCCYSH
jgi:hypothetical protein